MNNKELVSVCVITYNSAKYIIETLDSIKNQDYSNIELIISDDCSQDDTIAICKEWLNNNDRRFKSTKIVESSVNTGVPGNNNRALAFVNGEWVKYIAGDDILCSDCISNNICFVNEHTDADVLFSFSKKFYDCDGVRKIDDELCLSRDNENFFNSTQDGQYRLLLSYNLLNVPTSFIRAEVVKKQKFNELYRLMEDWPFYLNLLRAGYKFQQMKKITVLYRQAASITRDFSTYYSESIRRYESIFYWSELKQYIINANDNNAYNMLRKKLLYYELVDLFVRNKRKNKFTNAIVAFIHAIVYKGLKFRLS